MVLLIVTQRNSSAPACLQAVAPASERQERSVQMTDFSAMRSMSYQSFTFQGNPGF